MMSIPFTTRTVRSLVMALALIGITSTVSAQPIRYVVQDLGQVDGISSTAVAINDASVVAGWVETPGHGTRAARAVDGGTLQYVRGLDMLSSASGINAFGDLTGYALFSSSPWTLHAMRYTDAGGVEDLGSFGGDSFGVDINRHGQVAGWSYAGSGYSTRAFLATPGQPLLDLGALGGYSPLSFASGINDAGQVAGHSQTSTGRWHAFRYTPGLGLEDLGTPSDADSFSERINASGQVVGRMYSAGHAHAFRYTDGVGLQDLHTIAASSSWAFEINDAGTVVGLSFTSGAPAHAFLYTDADGMIDLNTRIDPASGWVLNIALGINNAGEIVGQGTYRGQIGPRAFKLTPRPVDVTPPEIVAAVANPAILWPANLSMMSVTVTVDVTDNMDPAPRCRIVGVTSSEPTDDAAMNVTGDLTLSLRAERNGFGNGRTYHVAIACSDASGNIATTNVDVRVPHDLSEGID